jgi:GT2 family glycosyltransferase
MSDIWCAIPVYNNAATISDIVARCRRESPDIVVIDDGSTDADLRELLKNEKIHIVRHPKNLGKGAALLTAFDFAAQRGAKYLITLDGDGQHYPEDIPQFLPRLREDTIVIGSREKVIGDMPSSSRFGREFSDFWICVESGETTHDTQSGFRAYPLNPIRRLPLASRHYNLEVEVVTRAVWAGMKIASVPIRVQYQPERVSSFRPFADNARISLMHTRLVTRQLLPIPHRKIFSDPHRPIFETLIWQNSTPLGLAATAALSALLGILLWPWGILAVGYLAFQWHLSKIMAMATILLCLSPLLPALSVRVGRSVASPNWARFVGAHIIAFTVAPLAAILVYTIARQFVAQPSRS